MSEGGETAGEEGEVQTLPVFDLNMAAAYYACVFDAEVAAAGAPREMRIGPRRYMLSKGGGEVEAVAVVEDADVCCARAVAKGGQMLEPVTTCAENLRKGGVRDPFGTVWSVRTSS